MSKVLRFPILIALLALVACTAAYAGPYPTVELVSFDPATFTYTYQVTQGLDAIDGFAQFEIDGFTALTDSYTMGGPSSNLNLSDEPWYTTTTWWNPQQNTAYLWMSMGDGVYKGSLLQSWYGQPWVGTFTLTAPGTQPVPGNAIVVMNTDGYRAVTSNIGVPGPVPEPSSLMALATMLIAGTAAVKRYRR